MQICCMHRVWLMVGGVFFSLEEVGLWLEELHIFKWKLQYILHNKTSRNITPRYSKLPMSEQKRGAASSRTGFLNLWSFDQKGRAAGYQTKCYFTFNTVECLNVPLWSHWSVVQTKNDNKIPKSLGIGQLT